MKKIFLILFIASSLLAQGQKNYLTTRSFNRGSTLYKNLIAFWKFDNSWEDSWGNNDLNPFGGAYVSATGKSGQAASFEADSTQYASINDNADLSFSSSENFMVTCWIKYESVTTNGYIAGKNVAEHQLILRTTARIREYIDATIYAQSNGTVTSGVWTFVAAWYNVATDSVYTQLNNGTPDRAVATTGPTDGANAFLVGGNASGYYDGLIEDLGIWGRSGNAITGKAMADSIYNAGNGWRP